jgi:transporter family protein
MWILLAVISSISLGFIDVFRKLSLERNNVFAVLLINVLVCTIMVSPLTMMSLMGRPECSLSAQGHTLIALKSLIVTISWLLGFASIKYLPLSISGSINAARPILVLVGAIAIFGESPNTIQWVGIILGFVSLLWVGFIGRREKVEKGAGIWIALGILSIVLWAASGLYDKWLIGNGYTPLAIEAWYPLYQTVIMVVIVAVEHYHKRSIDRFHWNRNIIVISVFIIIADLAYFYSLSYPESLVSIASMIRRGSSLVAFFYGIVVLKEKNLRLKIVDQIILIAGMTLIIVGSLN